MEAQTSAELVIAVRHRSGKYGIVAYHFGFGAMAAVTLILLITPQVFSIGAIVMDGLAAFVLAALVCANVAALTRALTRSRTRRANVETAARAAFFDLGITRTSGRSGILVFISTFERTLAVLTDVGIDTKALGVGWTEATTAIDTAIRRKDFEVTRPSFERLGPVLGAAMPRAADDVNELPGEASDAARWVLASIGRLAGFLFIGVGWLFSGLSENPDGGHIIIIPVVGDGGDDDLNCNDFPVMWL